MHTQATQPARMKKPEDPWYVVTLGIFTKVAGIRSALDTQPYKVSAWADDLLDLIPLPEEPSAPENPVKVEFVTITVADLGFPKGASFREICQRGQERGLKLCPLEAVISYRLRYRDQPKGERLPVAMDPLKGINGYLGIFVIAHKRDERLWLDWHRGHPDTQWYPSAKFVFIR